MRDDLIETMTCAVLSGSSPTDRPSVEKEMNNPIEAAMSYLQDCGYTDKEAENLLRAPRHESKDELAAMMDDWITHVGEHKKYQTCMLDLVAMGIITVNGRDENGDWLFQLDRDKAQDAGFSPEESNA